MGPAPRLFAVGALLAMLVWMSFEAVRYGIAGTASGNAGRELERALRAPSGPETTPWWRDDLRRASAEVPNDPSTRELLALAMTYSGNDPADLAEAERHLKAAIAARPGSGYTWANLAAMKYRLGDTGPLFEKALVNAATLAPYEPEVQRIVANFGLAVLDEMAPATRAAIERAVAAGMKRNAREILQIAARRGRLGVACRHLDGVPRPAESKWTQLCQSMEATS